MAENINCNEIAKIEKDISDIYSQLNKIKDKVNELAITTERHTVMFESLDDLPDCINKLNNTLVKVQTTLEYLDNRINQNTNSIDLSKKEFDNQLLGIDKKIKNLSDRSTTIDSKSKVDFLQLIQQNFVSIIIFIYIVYSNIGGKI